MLGEVVKEPHNLNSVEEMLKTVTAFGKKKVNFVCGLG